MIPEKQVVQLGQFETIKKKVKNQFQSQPFADQLYLEKQKQKLQYFLQQFNSYPKITAPMIQHQEKSIKTLRKQILEKFPQLRQRIQLSINCCKKNADFLIEVKRSLEKILCLEKPAHLQFNESIKNQGQPCTHGNDTHTHSHSQFLPSKEILDIFNHLCRQYSQQDIHKKERFFIEYVKENLSEYFDKEDRKEDNFKTLVLGCGMGVLLYEIQRLYEQRKIPYGSYFIQGHEQQTEHYLLAEYMLNHHSENTKEVQIFPYIHNFSNHLSSETPYTGVRIELPKVSSAGFPLTFGSFDKVYKSHNEEWKIIVSTFFNYSVTDVLKYIQLIYKMLKTGGIWIDISTACFDKHFIPYLSYQEYENILDRSQFTLVKKFSQDQLWYREPRKLMNQWRKVHYRVMRKQRLRKKDKSKQQQKQFKHIRNIEFSQSQIQRMV